MFVWTVIKKTTSEFRYRGWRSDYNTAFVTYEMVSLIKEPEACIAVKMKMEMQMYRETNL